jgi:hypothetical protein
LDNVRRKRAGRKNVFSDDCGIWDYKKANQKSIYLIKLGERMVALYKKVAFMALVLVKSG